MARDLTSGFIAEIEATRLCAAYLVELYFDSQTSRLWTGYGQIQWNGETYFGAASFGTIGKIVESIGVKANGTTLVMSSIPADMLALAMLEPYQGRPVRIYFAVLDKTTGAVIPDPYLIFKGKMDVMEIRDDAETGQITMTVENDLIDLFKPRNRNYTAEDQKMIYPDDLGLDFVASIQDIEIVWKDKEK